MMKRHKLVMALLLSILVGTGCAALTKVGLHVFGHVASDCLKDHLADDEDKSDDEPMGDERPADGTD